MLYLFAFLFVFLTSALWAEEVRFVAPSVATDAQEAWVLERGLPIHTQLEAWATRAGWQLLWRPAFSWLCAADTQFFGDFSTAISAVIEALYAEGQPVQLLLWESNRVAEVISHAP